MTTVSRYPYGATVRVRVEFTDENNATAAPSEILILFKKPSGTTAQATATAEAGGAYFGDCTTDEAGTWAYRVTASLGGAVAASEGRFVVEDSRFI